MQVTKFNKIIEGVLRDKCVFSTKGTTCCLFEFVTQTMAGNEQVYCLRLLSSPDSQTDRQGNISGCDFCSESFLREEIQPTEWDRRRTKPEENGIEWKVNVSFVTQRTVICWKSHKTIIGSKK